MLLKDYIARWIHAAIVAATGCQDACCNRWEFWDNNKKIVVPKTNTIDSPPSFNFTTAFIRCGLLTLTSDLWPLNLITVVWDSPSLKFVWRSVSYSVAYPGSEGRVGTGSLGDGSLPAGYRGGASVESGGEAPIGQIYTDSLQLPNAFLRRFVAQSVLHLPYPLPHKKLRICENPMTEHRRSRVGTCPPVAIRCCSYSSASPICWPLTLTFDVLIVIVCNAWYCNILPASVHMMCCILWLGFWRPCPCEHKVVIHCHNDGCRW